MFLYLTAIIHWILKKVEKVVKELIDCLRTQHNQKAEMDS